MTNAPWPDGQVPQQPGSPAVNGGYAPDQPILPAVAKPRRTRTAVVVWTIVGLILLTQLLVVVFGYLVLALGAGLTALGTILALVPLALVLLTATWIDSWEPEPWPAKLFAVLWGAAAAVSIALLADLGQQAFTHVSESSPLSSLVRAPIVEESAKGAALLILVFVARRTFDGPVDGIVYAAFVAGGFAFVENIQYFGVAIASHGVEGGISVFVLRAVFSPFAHVLFTSCTGFAVGWAARRGGVGRIIGLFLVGLCCAVALHALWNFSTYVNFWGVYFFVELPLFVVAVVIVVMLRIREQHTTFARLDEYGRAGWFTYQEVVLYGTRQGRRNVRAWARQRGGDAPAVVRRMIDDTYRLAMARQRLLLGGADPAVMADESTLLSQISVQRQRLFTFG
jgi:RsiW-degrading membrane proteinase PrsW (M82 family)